MKKYKIQAFLGYSWSDLTGLGTVHATSKELAIQQANNAGYKGNLRAVQWSSTIPTYTEKEEKMYLDYVNNFLTVSRFAEHYGISESRAYRLIGKFHYQY